MDEYEGYTLDEWNYAREVAHAYVRKWGGHSGYYMLASLKFAREKLAQGVEMEAGLKRLKEKGVI